MALRRTAWTTCRLISRNTWIGCGDLAEKGQFKDGNLLGGGGHILHGKESAGWKWRAIYWEQDASVVLFLIASSIEEAARLSKAVRRWFSATPELREAIQTGEHAWGFIFDWTADRPPFRQASGRVVAVLTRQFGVDKIEDILDAVQDAFEAALIRWRFSGAPNVPEAPLLTVARRKLINQQRGMKRITFWMVVWCWKKKVGCRRRQKFTSETVSSHYYYMRQLYHWVPVIALITTLHVLWIFSLWIGQSHGCTLWSGKKSLYRNKQSWPPKKLAKFQMGTQSNGKTICLPFTKYCTPYSTRDINRQNRKWHWHDYVLRGSPVA